MKNIYLILGSILIISACGGNSNSVDMQNDPQKNIFVSECINSANDVNPQGGDIYKNRCECVWNKTLKSMNNNEIAAMRREWSEPSDMQYYPAFITKTIDNSAACLN